jgi:NADH:ubiquinone reductase (H+-translocating)
MIVVLGAGYAGLVAAARLARQGDRPGSWLSPRAQAYVSAAFDRLGVEVVTGTVASVAADSLTLADGSQVPFDACIWAGGFRVTNLATGIAVNNRDRILVDAHLRSISHPDVYAIGDAAAASGPWGDSMAYGCRTGGFMGPYVADAIAGRTSKPFTFRYIHQCISLGRRDAVIQFVNGTDESPRRTILKGRLAVAYKNIVLGSAIWLFRHPGPFVRRRPSGSHISAETSPAVTRN